MNVRRQVGVFTILLEKLPAALFAKEATEKAQFKSDGNPYVMGKRVLFPRWPRPVVLGEFSCHWAAVAALVRLHQPDFKSLGGDKAEDIALEVGLTDALARAKS